MKSYFVLWATASAIVWTLLSQGVLVWVDASVDVRWWVLGASLISGVLGGLFVVGWMTVSLMRGSRGD
jgi:hypothetical protein